ncbi:hypothetical protein ACS0TY_006621 [Phlomoides rotata]
MESVNWDIEAVVNAIQPDFSRRKAPPPNFLLRGVQEIEISERDAFHQTESELLIREVLEIKIPSIHPKMEFSFFGNLNQRKMVNSSEFPGTEFFKMFAEMGRRIWLLHCLAFSFDNKVRIFQVKQSAKFSEVYMESVVEDIFTVDFSG